LCDAGGGAPNGELCGPISHLPVILRSRHSPSSKTTDQFVDWPKLSLPQTWEAVLGAGLNCSEIEVLLAFLRIGRRMAEQWRAFPPTNVRGGHSRGSDGQQDSPNVRCAFNGDRIGRNEPTRCANRGHRSYSITSSAAA